MSGRNITIDLVGVRNVNGFVTPGHSDSAGGTSGNVRATRIRGTCRGVNGTAIDIQAGGGTFDSVFLTPTATVTPGYRAGPAGNVDPIAFTHLIGFGGDARQAIITNNRANDVTGALVNATGLTDSAASN